MECQGNETTFSWKNSYFTCSVIELQNKKKFHGFSIFYVHTDIWFLRLADLLNHPGTFFFK